jgi:hypothetical protein
VFGSIRASNFLTVTLQHIHFCGAIALSLRVLLTLLLPLPKPAVHDESSYLLAADTFSHGRLTNPTHPMWIHFETFHDLSHPTYASMYPAGQGLFLAWARFSMCLGPQSG